MPKVGLTVGLGEVVVVGLGVAVAPDDVVGLGVAVAPDDVVGLGVAVAPDDGFGVFVKLGEGAIVSPTKGMKIGARIFALSALLL